MAIQFTGIASGMDTNAIVADLMRLQRTKVDKIQKDKTMLEWRKDAWKEMNTKLFSFYKKELFAFKSTSTYRTKTLTSSNVGVVSTNASPMAINGSHELEIKAMAKASFLTGEKLEVDKNNKAITASTTMGELIDFGGSAKTLNIRLDNGDYKAVTVNEGDKLSDVLNNIKKVNPDININFDSKFNRIFVSSKQTGEGIKLDFSGDNDLLNALGFSFENRIGTDGKNAIFIYNGTELTSQTNDIVVNGISLTIKGEGKSTISVTQDIDGVYNAVKDFIKKYNELVEEINTKINAPSARKYKPLTSDEKKGMAEDEIKLWEEKIKTSILRNDDILTNITRSMRNILTLHEGVDTSNFSYKNLSNLGIVTGPYTEGGLLHIEGDEEDSLYGVKENKLRKAIEENPEGVMELLTSLGDALYSDMADKMKSTKLSSALTFYNDKQIDEQVKDYEKRIEDFEERLTRMEERYYRQFTAMEKAIQQSNSTANWFAQQLGGM